jgi:hypothetical protein
VNDSPLQAVQPFKVFRPSDPPRAVPFMVRLRVLFGDGVHQFGWLFFGFGMIFVWVFVGQLDWSFLTFRGPLATCPGVVTGNASANASENKQDVFRIGYTFTTPGGQERAGVSYALGSGPAVGSKVTVEYHAENPGRSRIQGLRTGAFSPFAMFVVIFPLIGAVFVAFGLRRGVRGVRLLAHGLLAEGKMVARSATSMRVNKQTVFEYTFVFTAEDGKLYQAVGRTHTGLLEDEDREPLVYDPWDPRRAVMLGCLPGDPRIDEDGRIRVKHPLAGLAAAVIPLAAIVGNGAYLVRLLA